MTDASKLVISDGIATETIVASTRIMKKPITSAHRAGHGLVAAREEGDVDTPKLYAVRRGPPAAGEDRVGSA